MLRILGRRTSGNVMKPLWAADEMGLDYEQVDLGGKFGGNREPDYLAMNPMGLVPALVEDDFILWESNAIAQARASGPAVMRQKNRSRGMMQRRSRSQERVTR